MSWRDDVQRLTYVFDLINSFAGWAQLVVAVVLVGIVIALACTARVWAVDHWPSDVADSS